MSLCQTLSRAVLSTAVATTLSCSDKPAPLTPTGAHAAAGAAHNGTHASPGESEEKGYIDGWIDGEDVQLYYTRSFFCAEPPASAAVSNCELGAPGEVTPRDGPIPTIYAIAAVGFQPDPATVACAAGTPCLNHPAMIDASRVGGSPTASPPSHSHILSHRGGGWFNTVNIRVFNIQAWNQIAAAKTLAKVRELQGGNGSSGVPGVISADTPTNIYFFIAGAR
jgi:hypothetical protein